MKKRKLDEIDSCYDEKFFDEKFREIYCKALDGAVDKDVEEFKKIGKSKVEYTKRYKIKMNRFFRERVGGRIPYPEVDNRFERLRSKLVKKFKLVKNQ